MPNQERDGESSPPNLEEQQTGNARIVRQLRDQDVPDRQKLDEDGSSIRGRGSTRSKHVRDARREQYAADHEFNALVKGLLMQR